MAHENLRRLSDTTGSSDRSFGFVFAGVFLVIAALPMFHMAQPRWWALTIAVLFALVALLMSPLLSAPNRAWMRLGLLLGKIVSPIALGIVFFGVLTPISVIQRARGSDPLRLQRDKVSLSYWVLRKPPGPKPDSMTDQF